MAVKIELSWDDYKKKLDILITSNATHAQALTQAVQKIDSEVQKKIALRAAISASQTPRNTLNGIPFSQAQTLSATANNLPVLDTPGIAKAVFKDLHTQGLITDDLAREASALAYRSGKI